MADRVVLARVPAGQSLDLLAALCGLFGAAVPGGLMSAGDGYGNAAELVAPDGVTTRELVRTLKRATAKLNDGKPAPAAEPPVEHDDDPADDLTLNAMRRTETGVEFGIGGVDEQAREFAKGVIAAFIPVFETTNAVNYLSWDALAETGERYSLIVVKPTGLTPHEARQQAELEVERLRALLAHHGIEDPNA